MKFREIANNRIIEIKDATAIKRFQSYPDLFEELKEIKPKSKKDEE